MAGRERAGLGRSQAALFHLSTGSPAARARGPRRDLDGPNGEELDTVAIVTTAASPELSALHHRVPVAIDEVDFARWLDCSEDSAEPVLRLMAPPQDGTFTWHEVSTRVNHADNDDAQLILPITDEQRAAEAAPKAAKRTVRKAPPAATDDGQGSLF